MSLDEQKNKYRALDKWFQTPQGYHVGEAFAQHLSHVQDYLRGTTLLQLGVCGAYPWLNELIYRRKWLATPYLGVVNASMITSLKALPLERHSIDCVVAPLTMEAFGREKNPLDEIDRVLKPMGYAVFLGVNPFSLWGLCLKQHYMACFGDYSAALTSSLVLKQALFARGYRQCSLNMFYYIPPVRQPSLIRHFAFLNEMGKMIAPCPAGFYCLIVQKYQHIFPNIAQYTKKQRLILQETATGLMTLNKIQR